MENQNNEAPLGGIFVALGLIVGAMYGSSIGDFAGLIIGAIVGAGLGQIVENIIFRLIMFALGVLWFFARSAFWKSFWEGFREGTNSSTAQPEPSELLAALPHNLQLTLTEITPYLGLLS